MLIILKSIFFDFIKMPLYTRIVIKLLFNSNNNLLTGYSIRKIRIHMKSPAGPKGCALEKLVCIPAR